MNDSDDLELHETPPAFVAQLERIRAMSPGDREAFLRDFNAADGKAYAQQLVDDKMFQKMLDKFATIAPLPPSLSGLRSTSDQFMRLCGTAAEHRKTFRDLPKHVDESPEQRERRQARNRRKANRRKR
jgi:hypothetical protein